MSRLKQGGRRLSLPRLERLGSIGPYIAPVLLGLSAACITLAGIGLMVLVLVLAPLPVKIIAGALFLSVGGFLIWYLWDFVLWVRENGLSI